jgi:hypothetical protein
MYKYLMKTQFYYTQGFILLNTISLFQVPQESLFMKYLEINQNL